ncbi:four-carbon acid sugar kinase family protein [Sedimentitalea sp. JM2-8]|uniref:3-oxo-tetronate kinase n=1 Tax=Sedimentitalea xiamensis TaxID=3050037 RepID=A0ABT7FAY1_9RHOB|nr:3-oxo-tetronate kinase [Sedimentitalea xiamensis]MDK3072265.1 four-carbon acid sugar kinase family protein [Sedimentitalea xiamensis]
MRLKIGAIADDFTGATDLAVTLAKNGMKVAQFFGVPTGPVDLSRTDAVVVALKSRTIPAPDAVAQSLDALDWLQRHKAEQVFFKYCSTFDSTADGNIGPVSDELVDRLGVELVFVCPAFPVNGRTIYMGHLFVNDQLLSDSPMKDHPLTPMRDSNLVALMQLQSRHRVGLIPHATVSGGSKAIRDAADNLVSKGARYAVVDALDDNDLAAIGQAAAQHRLVTGGSAVAQGLPRNFGVQPVDSTPAFPSIDGRNAVLAGSCSAATRTQIDWIKPFWPNRRIDVEAIADGTITCDELLRWATDQPAATPILIHASADPGDVADIQSRLGIARSGALVETLMAELANVLRTAGFRRLVVAGGETSGAVVKALDLPALEILGEIDPGVPWTQTMSGPPMALALKSGNFGGVDFFEKAFKMLG